MSLSSSMPDGEAHKVSTSQVDERYRCGSLVYSKAGLAALFGWMIWGNICFGLFEGQGGYSILNLYLQDNFHISNLTVNILFNVIPMLIGTFMTPIISFKSDRTRGRWGRRIPYILFTAPFLAAFAAAIGFSDDIIRYCKAVVPETALVNPLTAALFVIGFMTIGYTFFNEFVATVYYYLLPDVMPRAFIGRFQGVSGMVGQVSGILTNMYIIPYQLTHMKAIHVGIAILYVVGLGLVCVRVKEGQYPPVEDVGEKTKFMDQVRLYFRESFTHPIFILIYLSTAATALTRGLNPAGIFNLHLAEHQAKVVAWANVAEPDAEPPIAANPNSHASRDTALVMAMTPDGQWIVSSDKTSAISVWDSTHRKPSLLKTVRTQDGTILSLAIAPDGKTAVCGTQTGTIQVFDITSGSSLQRLTAHAGGVRSVAISRDGTRLASAGTDKTVRIWDLSGGSCLQTLSGHDDQVNCVAFSSDATRVVSGGSDRKIIIWDAAIGSPIRTLEGHPGPVYAVCFAPAIALLPAHEQPAGSWAMAQVHRVGFFLKQVFTNESLYDIPADQTSKMGAADGWVLSGGRDGAKDSENSRVRIWDVFEGKQLHALMGHKGAIFSVAYKPDLRVIFSGSPDGSIRLWQPWSISDTADDQSYKTFSGYTRSVTGMAVADAGVRMVNASVDGTLHVWNIDQGISLAKGGLRGIFFSIIALVLVYPIGSLVDRWNPIRITIVCSLVVLPFPLFFFFWYNSYTFGLWMDLLRWPFTTLVGMASLPMMIALYPKTKYGQMCSANALVKQVVAAIAGPLGAILMDYLTTRSLDTDYFRYGFLFQFIASFLSFLLFLGVYYYWKKLGGENYVAPEAQKESVPAEVTVA